MVKSATDVMQEILVAATLDSIEALKAASKGVPNTLLRDLNAVHSNTTFADLPAELQTAIHASVRAAFTRMMREGYSVTAGQPAPLRGAVPHRDGPRGHRPSRPPGRPGGGPGKPGRPRG